MVELNYLDITKTGEGHIKVPAKGVVAPAITESIAKTALASFADGAGGFPFRSLVGYINPVQTGSGDPSPSNVRPITGWTGMNVYRTGKNLFSPTVSASTPRLHGATLATGNEEVTLTETSATNYCCYGVYYYLLAGTYTFKFQATASDSYAPTVTIYKSNVGIVSQNIQPNSARTFTLSEDGTIEARMFISTTGNGVIGRTVRFYEMQIETGSSASDWEPYNGTTYPISWADEAGTVYGGTLDVTTGVLTVTHEILTINDVSWNYYTPSSGNPYFYHTEPTKASVPVGSSENPLICSILPYGGSNYANQFTDGKIWQAANTNIYIVDTSVTTVSAMKTKYGTGTVVYPLATPQTYQLTPQAVMTILGQNNIWADTGDVEVAYCADTKMYIDKVIAAL